MKSSGAVDGDVPRRAAVTLDDVRLVSMTLVRETRGNLCVGDFEGAVPFAAKRFFFVYDVPEGEIRGSHAHRECEQFMIALGGSVAVHVDDGNRTADFVLDAPHKGLYVPAGIWGQQAAYTRGVTLLVFASHAYDPADYIRDHAQFRRERASGS